jgi:hypothetical protein
MGVQKINGLCITSMVVSAIELPAFGFCFGHFWRQILGVIAGVIMIPKPL